jgi:hypothetical protein
VKQFNSTQLKDLEYICELAALYLKGTGGTWPDRIQRYRELLLSMIEESPKDLYLVWSEEHLAWWKGGSGGYTRSLKEAGRYSYVAAMDIEANANRVLDIAKGEFHEVVVPDPLPL